MRAAAQRLGGPRHARGRQEEAGELPSPPPHASAPLRSELCHHIRPGACSERRSPRHACRVLTAATLVVGRVAGARPITRPRALASSLQLALPGQGELQRRQPRRAGRRQVRSRLARERLGPAWRFHLLVERASARRTGRWRRFLPSRVRRSRSTRARFWCARTMHALDGALLCPQMSLRASGKLCSSRSSACAVSQWISARRATCGTKRSSA